MRLSYRISDFAPHEEFRILINGELKRLQTDSTVAGQEDLYHIDPAVDRTNDNTFEYFQSDLLPSGANTYEISVISNPDKRDPTFVSKATAVIRRLSFTGTVLGGAYECIPAPNGKYAPALSSEPHMCGAGKHPDVESAHCELCEEGSYSPEQGDNCRTCPEYTFSSPDRTACIPYDIITDQRNNMHHLNKLVRPDVFCATQKNQNICDEGKREIGPIALPSVAGHKSQKVFFLSNKESLMTEMYDFHRSKVSPYSRVH